MSYFNDIRLLSEECLSWADMRQEQQASIQPTLRALRKALQQARRDLERAKPAPALTARQPNDLPGIRALRPSGPRRLTQRIPTQALRNRLAGAWAGRTAGCTLGAPVEGWSIEAMESLARSTGADWPPTDYWTAHPTPDTIRYGLSAMRDYLRDQLYAVPVDDDVTYTLLGLLILEEYDADFTTEDVGAAWLKYLPVACTAEHVALENLKAGIPPSKAAEKSNPFAEWIGADIRSDPWAYAAPGQPERAAEFAYRDAFLSHRYNGIYGAMFFAAAIAAAFAVDDPIEALDIGLTEIPVDCQLARDVRWALRTGPGLADWREAREAVDARFAGMSSVHTNNNACLTVFGLILGDRDFTRTVGMTVAMGLDNDCTAATAGSLLGAAIGIRHIPELWWKPFRNRTRTYLRSHAWFRNTDVVRRFMALARRFER
ncbi:MAG TPA: ADP-ribosylglycohydrolase family protein [Candidatus Hydrogenedentes bacterium]|nr:ADP-ribosylglycohydrolase family protein [Candidatus Hydrogenedentota bacterium]HPG68230.1 ADP-ribosylglycohydrolase family protein [Candidatus Hydrogenedentota bacterium]